VGKWVGKWWQVFSLMAASSRQLHRQSQFGAPHLSAKAFLLNAFKKMRCQDDPSRCAGSLASWLRDVKQSYVSFMAVAYTADASGYGTGSEGSC
jgi:hypothetical protein